jgi:tRNA (guanine-N7-)-methyltransferase
VRRRNRLPLEALAPYLLPVPEQPGFLEWPAVFGNDNPVEIEIGFGKGLFLITASEACPAVNFLGIEVVRKYQLFTATRLAKRHRTNVRLACSDARLFLRDYIGPATVQAVHVYFPDPWSKKRHHKRRVFTPEFVRECARVLWPGGLLHVVTDVEDYFVLIAEMVGQQTTLRRLPPAAPREAAHDLDYLTNFERKARKRGGVVYRADYEKGVQAGSQKVREPIHPKLAEE